VSDCSCGVSKLVTERRRFGKDMLEMEVKDSKVPVRLGVEEPLGGVESRVVEEGKI